MLAYHRSFNAHIEHFTITRVNPLLSVFLENYHRATIFDLPNGLNTLPRPKPIVVSLTSIPSRLFQKADITISTLLRQSCRPDHVILWLSNALRDHPLPKTFAHLLRAGLEVRYCEDAGPHTKLIYTLQAYPDCLAVTADDDLLYPPTWLGELYASYQKAPHYIHCHRAHLIRRATDGTLLPYAEWDYQAPGTIGPSHLLFPTSGAGILFPPNSLPDETQNKSAFQPLCPSADDVWYKAMALVQGTLCQKVKAHTGHYLTLRGSQAENLFHINATQNDPQIRATFEAYNLYPKLWPPRFEAQEQNMRQ